MTPKQPQTSNHIEIFYLSTSRDEARQRTLGAGCQTLVGETSEQDRLFLGYSLKREVPSVLAQKTQNPYGSSHELLIPFSGPQS